eukprot:3456169-Rhodomonas_salina.7
MSVQARTKIWSNFELGQDSRLRSAGSVPDFALDARRPIAEFTGCKLRTHSLLAAAPPISVPDIAGV